MNPIDKFLANEHNAKLVNAYHEKFSKKYPRLAKKTFLVDQSSIAADEMQTQVRAYLEMHKITPLKALVLGVLMVLAKDQNRFSKHGMAKGRKIISEIARNARSLSFMETVAGCILEEACPVLGEKISKNIQDQIISEVKPYLGVDKPRSGRF